MLPLRKSILGRGLSLSYKKCQSCDKFGHKGSQCKNRARHTKSEDKSDKVIRKYITVKVLNYSVRFQLDSGSNLSIINLQTWRKLNRPIIKMTRKTARTVTGDKIKFEGEIIIPVSLNCITKKIKDFLLKNTENLFVSDWVQKFNLWDQPINTFCQKVECITTEAEKIKMELKVSFPKYFQLVLANVLKLRQNLNWRKIHAPFLERSETYRSLRPKK